MGLLDNYLPRTGEILAGRYRLEEEIGRGAFGVVFRAVHESLDSNVAVKVLRPRVVDEPHVRKRFEREIAVAKTLQHPNSIRILDVDATLKGLPFYVMEYIDGHTLREVIRADGPLPPERLSRITEQILKSLAEAHARGIVHRDLKPGNIMLYDLPGETDVVKVLDFGIAKALGSNESFETAIGTVLGTPYYMSPEQAAGATDLDARSDLYALGIIIADCVGCSPEYEADTAMEHLAAQLMPDPLPFPASIDASGFGGLIRKATEKVPSRRYQSAAEMREALAAREKETPPPPVETPQIPLPGASESVSALGPVSVVDEKVSVSLLLPESRSKLYALVGVAALLVVAFIFLPTMKAAPPHSAATAPPTEPKEPPPPAQPADSGAAIAAPIDAVVELQAPPPVAVPDAQPVIALARLSVGSAVARRHTLDFAGPEGAEISVAGRPVGVLPFSIEVPDLPVEVEFSVSRRGHTDRAVGRLDAGVIEVPDPVPRHSSRSGGSRREPEPAPSTEERTEDESTQTESTPTEPTPTPFGTAPIHD